MASVYLKRGRWYLRVKDGSGVWRCVRSDATRKTEAERLAHELELRHERQRLGLEPLPDPNGGGTVAELMEWWLATYVGKRPSAGSTAAVIRKHITRSKLGHMRLAQVRP